jgi:putative transposase
MNANRAALPVRTMCRVLDVSPSGFDGWLGHAPSQRKLDGAVLLQRIGGTHAESDGTCGAPSIRAELAEQGRRVGRKRVARLMRQGSIADVSRRRGFVVTTQRDERQHSCSASSRTTGQTGCGWPTSPTANLGWVHLPGRRSGRVEPARGGRVHRPDAARRPGTGGAEHGIGVTQGARPHSRQRPGQPVHPPGVRPALPGDGRAPLDGQRRRRLRQRDGRELPRHAGVRAAQPPQLHEQGRGAHVTVHLHRGLVKPRCRHSAPGDRSPAGLERLYHYSAGTPPPSAEHGLPTVGARVASAAPPVNNPAEELIRAPSQA